MYVTKDEVEDAVNTLDRHTLALHDDKFALTDAKATLKISEAKLLAEGIEGKNAETRNANLILALSAEYEAVEKAEKQVALTLLDYTLSKLHWEKLKWLIRLAGTESQS